MYFFPLESGAVYTDFLNFKIFYKRIIGLIHLAHLKEIECLPGIFYLLFSFTLLPDTLAAETEGLATHQGTRPCCCRVGSRAGVQCTGR